jgi:hypothetical protein
VCICYGMDGPWAAHYSHAGRWAHRTRQGGLERLLQPWGGARAFWGCNCPYVEKRKRLGQSPEDKSTRALTIPSQAQHRPFGTTLARASYVMGCSIGGAFIRLLIRSQVPSIPQSHFVPGTKPTCWNFGILPRSPASFLL